MPRPWTLTVLLGLSAGALAGGYVVSPNTQPGYVWLGVVRCRVPMAAAIQHRVA